MQAYDLVDVSSASELPRHQAAQALGIKAQLIPQTEKCGVLTPVTIHCFTTLIYIKFENTYSSN